ncbi:MAG: hypothetical protein ACPGUI_00475 [Halarcobacter sp.]
MTEKIKTKLQQHFKDEPTLLMAIENYSPDKKVLSMSELIIKNTLKEM